MLWDIRIVPHNVEHDGVKIGTMDVETQTFPHPTEDGKREAVVDTLVLVAALRELADDMEHQHQRLTS